MFKYLICVVLLVLTFSTNSLSSTAVSIIKKISLPDSVPSHKGIIVTKFYRNNKIYKMITKVTFLSPAVYKLVVLEPDELRNIHIADGKNLTVYFPKQRMKVTSRIRTEENQGFRMEGAVSSFFLNIEYDRFNKNYKTTLLGNVEFLKRKCYKIRICGDKFSRLLLVDKDKNLILKEERFYNNKIYYSREYTKISYDVPKSEELNYDIPTLVLPVPQGKTTVYKDIDSAKKRLGDFSMLSKLPKGFSFYRVQETDVFGAKGITCVYSDGLTFLIVRKNTIGKMADVVSAFFGKDVERLREEMNKYSPSNFYRIEKPHKNYEIVLRGEFPTEILKEHSNYVIE